MRTDRDVTRVVRAWLNEDRHEDADRILDAVLTELEATPQRRSLWRARNNMAVGNTVRMAIAAAAVVVIAFIGYQLLSSPDVVDPGPTETPQPTPTPAQSAAPARLLEPGVYTFLDRAGVRATVTVPAGWYSFDPVTDGPAVGAILKNDSGDPPDGAAILPWTGDLIVYGDPCLWFDSRPDPPTGPTVDDLVAALSAQSLRDASPATDITVDGYAGKAIELTVPADLNFADCDAGEFRSWQEPTGGSARFHQGPGQHDLLWIIDVDGTRVVIDASFFEGTSATDMAELQAILESIQIES